MPQGLVPIGMESVLLFTDSAESLQLVSAGASSVPVVTVHAETLPCYKTSVTVLGRVFAILPPNADSVGFNISTRP